jgi:hypothetical protein
VNGFRIPEQLRDIAGELKAQGWTAELRSGGHIGWQSPSGAVVISSGSPSDSRSKLDFVARLRRAGAVIEGRGASQGNGNGEEPGGAAAVFEPGQLPGAPAGDRPSSMPEADGLRELITEGRLLLGELKAERRQIAKLLKGDAADLISSEIVTQLEQFDIKSIVHDVMGTVRARNEAELESFITVANKALRAFDRGGQRRIDEANDAIDGLRAIRDGWENAVSKTGGIPPAYRSRK